MSSGAPRSPPVLKHRSLSAVEPCAGEPEGETGDGAPFLGVPMRARGCGAPYDAFRRHSWEPGKVLDDHDDPDFNQRSVSLRGLDIDEMDSPPAEEVAQRRLGRRDPRRTPIIHSNDELESLLSQDEDEDDPEVPQEHANRMQLYRSSPNSACNSLSKSVSLSGIDNYPDADAISLYADGVNLTNGFETAEEEGADPVQPPKEGTTLGRTLSFLRKMAGKGKLWLAFDSLLQEPMCA